MFVHTVYFWVKEGTPAAAVDQLAKDGVEILGKIPTVRHVWTGRPAMTPRDVVDNSYAVGLTVVLDDSAGHDIYQKHELHQQFISRNKARWSRIQVYDFS
jgi:hypothetical protein